MALPAKPDDLTTGLMGRTLGVSGLDLPFGREIFLLETPVAGVGYYDAQTLVPSLREGDPLVLRREPTNPHDPLAVEILTREGGKLGYLPRARNPVLARLLDGDKILRARVRHVRGSPGDDPWTMEVRLDIVLVEL